MGLMAHGVSTLITISTIRSSIGTLAAVASLLTPAVDAAVQVSPISNEPLPGSSGIFIDIDGNGVDDFEINADFQVITGVSGNGAVTNGGGALLPLSSGNLINGAESFNSSGDFGGFLSAGNQFAGFEFSFPDSVFGNGSIVSGAWETVSGNGIEVGAIPEPSDAALAGGVLAGIVAFFRRKFRRNKD